MSFSFVAWSTSEWKIIAETTSACKEKRQVLAKEGEGFVYITEGDTKTKLFAADGSTFSEQNGKAIVFSNTSDKTLTDSTKRYTFIQPSMVDGNPPKLSADINGVKENCKLILK
jgi:hypothetical protein